MVQEHELVAHYVTRLHDVGFTNVTTKFDEQNDPTREPHEVTSVDPAPGQHAGTDDEITVGENPEPAPNEGGGDGGGGSGGLFTPPDVPSVRWPSIPTPCNVFPFGAPCWVFEQLASLEASPVAPAFSVGTPYGLLHVDLGNVAGVDLDSLMAAVRPILLVLATLGLVMWLATAARTGSTSESGEVSSTSRDDD